MQQIKRIALPIYLIGLALLIGVALFGEIYNGARRWLNIGITRIQPSELMKIAISLMTPYFDKYEITLRLGIIGATLLLVIPAPLILKQPDLGTALLIAAKCILRVILRGTILAHYYWFNCIRSSLFADTLGNDARLISLSV